MTIAPTAAVTDIGPPPAVTMTLVDIARELRVSTRQVRRMLSIGTLPPADISFGSLKSRRWLRARFYRWCAADCPRAEVWASAGG